MGTLASYNILSRMMLLFDMIVRLSALNFYLFIINTAKRIVGIGYNGFPHGCNDMLLSLGERPMMVQWSRQYHGSIRSIRTKNLLRSMLYSTGAEIRRDQASMLLIFHVMSAPKSLYSQGYVK